MSKDLPSVPTALVCFCNNVSQQQILQAIAAGATDLNEIYESCGAGVGPCGGTCRIKIKKLLAAHTRPKNEPSASLKSWDPPSELLEALSLFNRRYYWESHEVLEGLWLEIRGPERLFYQGIIQAAATFYHVLNANPRGVMKLAQDSQDKLKKFLPAYESIPLKSLIASLEDFKTQAREIMGNMRSGFEYDRLPKISIDDIPKKI